jgi:hypothetical protein
MVPRKGCRPSWINWVAAFFVEERSALLNRVHPFHELTEGENDQEVYNEEPNV